MDDSKKYIFLLPSYMFLVFFSFLTSCKKDKPVTPVPDLGVAYFPLNTGSWIIYDVDSIVHDDFLDSVITYRYQVKELVESKYTDNTGKELFRIERYKRNSSSAGWLITDVWASAVNSSRAEKFEENIWYIKLIFPVKENAKWNGNAFNSMDIMEYTYTAVNIADSINGHNFDSTLTVLQSDDPNAILKIFAEEKYAKNVGMIYKEYINLKLDQFQEPVSGIEFIMRINSFGR